ncbi:MAG: RcpC/CpaB family pilus assembly protein [Acidimicrobiia bacterium]|nr:RcpC/CpaB family pilus assembly protein [Acidimicrobiia bacterium]
MSARRTVILIVAVALGALAAVGLLSYVRSAESGAGEAGAPVEVWVATALVPKGTPVEVALEQGLIGTELVAQRLRPATAVVDPRTELAGLVAVHDLQPNMAIVTGTFVSSTIVNTGITDRLEETGKVTVTVSVDQTRGAAYLIEPGDFVNVMVERNWDTPFFENDPPIEMTDRATAELAANLTENDSVRPIITDLYPVDARMVYQKAEVLAVGQALIPDIGESAEGDGEEQAVQIRGLITLAVPPEAAQIILNVGRDDLYLSLVPDDYEPRPILPIDPTGQVLPGEDGARLTPYVGFDDVVDPTQLAAVDADGESRIGTAPRSGSSDGSGSTSDDTGTTDDGFDPDSNPPVPTTVPEGTEGTDSSIDGGEGEGN